MSLTVCCFYKNTFHITETCIILAQIAIVSDHQSCLSGLAGIADSACAIVAFKQAFFDGGQALHGILELAYVRAGVGPAMAVGKLTQLLLKLVPFIFVRIFHSATQIVAKHGF